MNLAQYDTSHQPTWCPGCGDFGIWMSLKNALITMNLGNDDVFVVYGVGCHGNMSGWLKTYGFNGLHGRTLPVAQGFKLAHHDMPVIIISGDGDGMGEGGNHFIHAAKRNADVTVLLFDNQVYGLTTGQASPTARPGLKTKSTPAGVVDAPLSPVGLALTAGATFVARGFAGDAKGLSELIVKAVQHKGFSLVDILQPCVTFNKDFGYPWYREHIYQLSAEGYTPDNKVRAFEKSLEWGDKVPVGLFYEEQKPSNEDHYESIHETPLYRQAISSPDIDALLAEFV